MMAVIWIGDGTSLYFQLLFRLTWKCYILVGLDIYNLSANYNGRKHWSMKARNLWSFWSTLGRERSTTSTKSCSLSSVPNEWQLHLSLEHGLIIRPVTGNRRPPVPVYRSDLAGYRSEPVKSKFEFKLPSSTGSYRYTGRLHRYM